MSQSFRSYNFHVEFKHLCYNHLFSIFPRKSQVIEFHQNLISASKCKGRHQFLVACIPCKQIITMPSIEIWKHLVDTCFLCNKAICRHLKFKILISYTSSFELIQDCRESFKKRLKRAQIWGRPMPIRNYQHEFSCLLPDCHTSIIWTTLHFFFADKIFHNFVCKFRRLVTNCKGIGWVCLIKFLCLCFLAVPVNEECHYDDKLDHY